MGRSRQRAGPGPVGDGGREACDRMPRELLTGSARRVAALSVAAVAVIAAVIGGPLWRYETARARAAGAVDARHDARLTEQLVATFWHEHEAMNEYVLAPSSAIRREIRSEEHTSELQSPCNI